MEAARFSCHITTRRQNPEDHDLRKQPDWGAVLLNNRLDTKLPEKLLVKCTKFIQERKDMKS